MGMSSSSHGERRQLTVMFSDLVGSTELSAQLDPEDLHDIVTEYHQTATNAVKRFDGHVSQYMGDGVLILFGYPRAHENDAERGVLAGLALLEDMKSLNKQLEKKYKRQLSVRVGIHTGEVMIGSKAGDTGNLFGETPNIAARVQSTAEPNTVCISSATQHLIAGFFVVDNLGPHILKGVPGPVELYRVERATGVRGRLHTATKSSRTPFVGREDERNLLMSRWMQAQKGKGQLAMITGEAGIGKSRLLQQFKDDLGGIPHTWIEGESSPYEQDTPFAPTLDLVTNAFHWNVDTPPDKKIEGLEDSFSLAGMDPAKSVPLMASLFGIDLPPGRYPPILLSAEQQRFQLLQTLVDWVTGSARLQPTVLVVEDLHFADPSTLEEFQMLGEQIENVPVLLIFTARPRFQPPWPTQPFHTLIHLNRLDQENIREMIEGLLGKLLPTETVESLVTRTDGVPLFAEELSHAIAETRAATTMEQQIPATLQDLLMARLDFLGSIKEIAQIGAVLGRDFSYSLLSAVAGLPKEDLQNSLARLVDSGLVLEKSVSSETIYTFKHALVQEAAYGSLLKSRRRELHRAIAKALNESFSDVAKSRPELVAQHLTQAGDTEPAVEAWQAAGDLATSRAALVEAMQHFKKALELLNTLPESDERDHMELPIQLSLAHVSSALKGFGSAEEMQSYSRARQISEKLGNSVQFLIIMLGLWGSTNSRSEIAASREISNELLRLAERDGGSMMLTWAHESQAIEAYAQGDFTSVGKHFELMQKFYIRDELSWAPFDPFVTTCIHASLALWHVGYADQARELLHKQQEHAQTTSPANIAMAHLGTCSLYINMQEPEIVLKNAEIMSQIGVEQQLPSFQAWANLYRGIAWIQQGQHEKGIAQLTTAVGEYLATGTHSSLGEYLGILAEGYAGAGDFEQALIMVKNAFGATPEEKMHLPKLHRIHADILWKRPNANIELVEKTYHQSIEVSRQFGSISEELHAVTHLGRLLQSCGRSSEALALLTPLYAKFTEGFDTLILREAKKLMDELS
jgi:class 3 adenylate cyclase/tetratricopeptide (TPR) repeat protein